MNGQTASEIKQSAVTFFGFLSLCDTQTAREWMERMMFHTQGHVWEGIVVIPGVVS